MNRFLLRRPKGSECAAEEMDGIGTKRQRTWCAHAAAAALPPLSLVEHAEDAAKLANLKVQLTNLLVSLFGEARLTEMGFPEKDILAILVSVLEAARAPVEDAGGARGGGAGEGKGGCGDCCGDDAVAAASGVSATQVKFRELRREIAGARKNVRRLLEICVPDSGECLTGGQIKCKFSACAAPPLMHERHMSP